MRILTGPLLGPNRSYDPSTSKGVILALLLCGPALTFSPRLAAAQEDCSVTMGTVCVDAVKSGDVVTLSARNRETYQVTITFDAKLKNMTSSEELPHTRTLDGGFRGVILTLRANSNEAWKWDYTFRWTIGSITASHDESVVYELPYRGVHKVIQGFHGKFSHTGDFEYAVDWEMPEGTPVYAAREGIVVGTRSHMKEGAPDRKMEHFANFVMVRHTDGTLASYDHLKPDGVAVKVGTQVERGQLLGILGKPASPACRTCISSSFGQTTALPANPSPCGFEQPVASLLRWKGNRTDRQDEHPQKGRL